MECTFVVSFWGQQECADIVNKAEQALWSAIPNDCRTLLLMPRRETSGHGMSTNGATNKVHKFGKSTAWHCTPFKCPTTPLLWRPGPRQCCWRCSILPLLLPMLYEPQGITVSSWDYDGNVVHVRQSFSSAFCLDFSCETKRYKNRIMDQLNITLKTASNKPLSTHNYTCTRQW